MDSVLAKAVAILRAFAVDDTDLSLAELVRRTGLHKATAFRLCAQLVELRLLEKSAVGYRLSAGMFELGMRASVERSLLELAMPFLQDLYERTHEVVHLGVREGHEVVYVAKLGGHRQVRSPSRVGGRMPLHCTALGKAFLAYDADLRREVLGGPLTRRTPHTVVEPRRLSRQLATVRQQQVAFEREESALGLTCVAVPVLDRLDRPYAAISLAGPTTRFRPENHQHALRAAGAAVGALVARRQSTSGDGMSAPGTSPGR